MKRDLGPAGLCGWAAQQRAVSVSLLITTNYVTSAPLEAPGNAVTFQTPCSCCWQQLQLQTILLLDWSTLVFGGATRSRSSYGLGRASTRHHSLCRPSQLLQSQRFQQLRNYIFCPPPSPKLTLFWMEEDIPGRKFSKIRFKTVEFYALLNHFFHIFPWSFKVNSRSSAGGSFVLRLIRGQQISPNLATVQGQYSSILRQ